ncbi:MAG: hypothetical protein AAF560_02675 [Acidobacteriota bacterium]
MASSLFLRHPLCSLARCRSATQPAGFAVSTDGFHLGVGGWDAQANASVGLCHDRNGSGGEPAWASTGPGSNPWFSVEDVLPHNALGVRVKLAEIPSLTSIGGWILPGFEVDIDDADGPTVQWAIRNQADEIEAVDVRYYGRAVTSEPLRDSIATVGPQGTLATDIRFNLNDLEVQDGFATGLVIAKVAGGGTAGITADYFRIDTGNAFATGNRWVNPAELCDTREARLADFGSGTTIRILLDKPLGPLEPSFGYKVYGFNGNLVSSFLANAAQHYFEIDASELAIDVPFGTIVFDFSPAGGGWVSARYSAFGQFSTEVVGGCQ